MTVRFHVQHQSLWVLTQSAHKTKSNYVWMMSSYDAAVSKLRVILADIIALAPAIEFQYEGHHKDGLWDLVHQVDVKLGYSFSITNGEVNGAPVWVG